MYKQLSMKLAHVIESEHLTIKEGHKLFSRIMLRAEQRGECIIWTAGTSQSGHARFWFNRKIHQVTRLIWLMMKGEVVPADKVMMHSCDVRRCINIDHIRPDTQQENVLDCVRKGRYVDNISKYNLSKKLNNLQENPENF